MPHYLLSDSGPLITTERDATDIVGEAFGEGADLVVIPAARLAPEFFRLGSGFAGTVLQKFTNYRLRVAIVGDISAEQGRPLDVWIAFLVPSGTHLKELKLGGKTVTGLDQLVQ